MSIQNMQSPPLLQGSEAVNPTAQLQEIEAGFIQVQWERIIAKVGLISENILDCIIFVSSSRPTEARVRFLI